MNGKFYAVGVGPGDPELLTLQAVRVIGQSAVIALPDSGGKQNLALEIAGAYIKDQEVQFFSMPMSKDRAVLEEAHRKAVETLAALLSQGKQVAFLTLGDPTIYSTVMYLHRRLTAMGFDTAIVNGIPSFCAAAAALNRSLCEREQPLHLIPATHREMDEVLALPGTKVLMKSGKELSRVRDALRGKEALLVECATMPSQRVFDKLEEAEDVGYFSIVLLPAEETGGIDQ